MNRPRRSTSSLFWEGFVFEFEKNDSNLHEILFCHYRQLVIKMISHFKVQKLNIFRCFKILLNFAHIFSLQFALWIFFLIKSKEIFCSFWSEFWTGTSECRRPPVVRSRLSKRRAAILSLNICPKYSTLSWGPSPSIRYLGKNSLSSFSEILNLNGALFCSIEWSPWQSSNAISNFSKNAFYKKFPTAS